jgi:hypothetical protein
VASGKHEWLDNYARLFLDAKENYAKMMPWQIRSSDIDGRKARSKSLSCIPKLV